MFAISVTTEGEGLVRFEGRLRAIERNLGELPLASAAIMEELEKYTNARWGEGEQVETTTEERWGNLRHPLEITGTLRGSLTKATAPGAVRKILPYGFEWGTSVYYARFLAKGTRKILTPKPVVRSKRALRALVGYHMRQWILRGRHVAAQARYQELTSSAGAGMGMDAATNQVISEFKG